MRILVLAMAGIGDSLIATPLIHELRANYPEATIDALVLWAGARDLLAGNPHLNTVHQKNLIKEGTAKSLRYLAGLRSRRYDVSINTHTLGRIHYRFVARIIGAPIRLSHEYENFGWMDRLLVNRTLPQDYSVHSIVNNNRLLGLLGKQPVLPNHELEIFLSAEDKEWAKRFVSDHCPSSGSRLGIHVGSGGTKNLTLKRWPLEHYIPLLKRLGESHPAATVLMFGGPEEEKAHEQIRKEVGNPSFLFPRTNNLRQTAALLQYCDAFLSVDSVLMHVAAAMKVPHQIVIEAPTLNSTNLPWHNRYRLVHNPVINGRNLDYYRYDGQPIKGTEQALRACMASIQVEDVFQAVKEALDFPRPSTERGIEREG